MLFKSTWYVVSDTTLESSTMIRRIILITSTEVSLGISIYYNGLLVCASTIWLSKVRVNEFTLSSIPASLQWSTPRTSKQKNAWKKTGKRLVSDVVVGNALRITLPSLGVHCNVGWVFRSVFLNQVHGCCWQCIAGPFSARSSAARWRSILATVESASISAVFVVLLCLFVICLRLLVRSKLG